MADGAVLHAEGRGEHGDGSEPAVTSEGQHARTGERSGQAQDERLPRNGGRQPSAWPGGGQGMRRPAAGHTPAMNPAIAMTAAAGERPEFGFVLKPRNTTLPVMFATNTWPSRR